MEFLHAVKSENPAFPFSDEKGGTYGGRVCDEAKLLLIGAAVAPS